MALIHRLRRAWPSIGVAITFVPAVALASLADEVKVAVEQSALAHRAASPAEARDHLQQAINCLVGPASKAFDAKASNPCAGLGAGAIADTKDVLNREKLQRAATRAQEALAGADLAALSQSAERVHAQLGTVHY